MKEKYKFLKDKVFEYGKAPMDANIGFVKINLQKEQYYIDKVGGIPEELMEFYLEIGVGIISQSINGLPKYTKDFTCSLMRPENIWKAVINYNEEPQYTRYDVRRKLPFYKICQGTYLHFSKSSNGIFKTGIFDSTGLMICKNLEEFICRCYFEDATFWLNCHGQVKMRTKNRKVVKRNV